MYAAHPLLEPVGIPRNVVVEHHVAALKVNPFAGRLGCDKDLNRAFAELLLGVEARALFVAGTGTHPAMDETNLETPLTELVDQVVERVLELGEDEQPLGWIVEESLILQDGSKFGELGLGLRVLEGLRLLRELFQIGDFLTHLGRILRKRYRLKEFLETFAVGLLHLSDFVGFGQVQRGGAREFLRTLEALGKPPGAIFKRMPHRVGARCEPALVKRHQEADRASPRIVVLRGGAMGLGFNETR